MRYFVFSLALAVTVLATRPAWPQQIIAHRGASHLAPENTLASFRLAWELGADGIEADFHLTSDGKIVCIHDNNTKRVADEDLVVRDTALARLRSLDVGSWKDPRWHNERIPLLEEVLETLPRGKLAFLELKCGPEIVAPLIDVLNESGVPLEQIVVISFNAGSIAELEHRLPSVKTNWLVGFKQEDDGAWSPKAEEIGNTVRSIGADGVGARAVPEYFDGSFIAALRSKGVPEFGVWTVDDPEVGDFYRSLGAWAITTNRPGFLREEVTNLDKKRDTPQ